VTSSDAASAPATYKWVAPSDFKMQKGDTYEAVYAPNYEPDSNGELITFEDPTKTTGEYLTCTGSRPIYISFERQYSRLRVNCGESADDASKVTITFGDGFTSNEPGSDVKSFTLTPDGEGNAYVYGSWKEGTKLDISSVISGDPETGVMYYGDSSSSEIKSASTSGKSYAVAVTDVWAVYNLDKASETRSDWSDATKLGFTKVKVIGEWSDSKALTFNASNVTEVDLSEVTGLTTTPEDMFSYSKIKSVTLPEGLETISKCFQYCFSLSEITIPKSVKAIVQKAFYYSDGISKVNISDIDAWCNIDFEDRFSNPLQYAKHLYLNGEEVTHVTIPESCTTINAYLFNNCIGLKSVTIHSSVESIGKDSFYYTGLTSLTIPASVKSISDFSIWYCLDLKLIDSSSSAKLESSTFYNNTSLKTVILRSASRVTISSYTFSSSTSACLYVPSDLVDDYKANELGGIKAENVKSIDELPEDYQ
jgi:hypothetical protein